MVLYKNWNTCGKILHMNLEQVLADLVKKFLMGIQYLSHVYLCTCIWMCAVCSQDNISATTGKFAFASGMPQLPAGQVVEALSKWEGMEDTLALFDERLAAEKSGSTIY